MTKTICSKVTGKAEMGNRIQLAHTNQAGQVLRVSEYMEKAGEHRPLSDMIHYPDGSKNLHLYNEAGDVEKVIQYNKFGTRIDQ